MKPSLSAFAILLFLPFATLAHGPTPQQGKQRRRAEVVRRSAISTSIICS
jgi:hypothetical protein